MFKSIDITYILETITQSYHIRHTHVLNFDITDFAQ